MKQKPKICKSGKGKAIGFDGCGEDKYLFKYGLCKTCFIKWATSTKEGNDLIKRYTISAKHKIESDHKKETIAKKKEIMSVDEYRSKIVQPIFNEIARLIDYGQPCIATGKFTGKNSGGHFHAIGSNRTLALNLHNIHVQSFHSNSWKSGDTIKYRNGLLMVYGKEYLDMVEALNSIKPIHLSKPDLEEIKINAQAIRNELKQNLIVRSPEERIKLREEINIRIGIYN